MNRKLSLPILMVLIAALALLLNACVSQPQAAASADSAPPAAVEHAPTDAPATDPAAEPAASAAQNLTVVRRFYDEFNAGNAEVILEIHPPAIRMHYAGEAEDVETKLLYEDLAALKQVNPDLRAEVKDMFAAGDLVVTELTWTTTHSGDYFGIPPTGKTSMHNGIVVRRLENGLIVESWEMWDDLVFLQSIGYLADWDTLIANGPLGMAELLPEPVVEPTQEPLPAVSQETFLGMWTQSDSASGGNNWLRFQEDGTWEAKHGPSFDGILVASGTFALDGDQLTLSYVETPQDLPNCAQGETFQLSFRSRTMIRFDVVEGCDLLATDFVRLPLWKQVIP